MSVNGLSNTSFPLTLSGLTLTDDLSGTYIPYANASNAINLNNQAVSNVASLAVVGTVSGAIVTSSGAVNGSSLAITNHATSNSLTVGTQTFVVSKIFSYVFSSTFIVYVTNMPSYWVVGDTIQVTGIASFSPSFNRVYTINSFSGTAGFYTTFVNIPGVPGYYETSSGSCYRTSGAVGQVFSDSVYNVNNASTNTLTVRTSASIANATCTGTLNASAIVASGAISGTALTGSVSVGAPTVSATNINGTNVIGSSVVNGLNITASGTLNGPVGNITTLNTSTVVSSGAIITNSTSAIGYWLPINGSTSIYMTDTSANVLTPATTFSRYFATGGNVYQDFYGTFYWRGSTTLNAGNVVQRMSLSTTAFNVSVGTAITGTFDVTGNTTIAGILGVTGNTGVTGNVSILGTFGVTGVQSLKAGAFGSSGDYTTSTTDIYGSTQFDGSNCVNIQCQASQYGRNILYLSGRYEASNDAFSFFAPRNAISFRTQSTLNSGYTNRYTIQNFADQLGIMSAGGGSTPITKWANNGTMTHTGGINIGGSIISTSTDPLYVANACTIWAKNSAGTNQVFLHPIYSDNVTYLNYGSSGWSIRNNTGTNVMFLTNGGSVGIGNTSPICALDCVGIANIWTGSRYAVAQGFMSAGSLTLGSQGASYGGGTSGWNSSTAGLLFETSTNTEIAVHHSGVRLTSMMYYRGSNNVIQIGRDMGGGWGNPTTTIDGQLNCQKALQMLTGRNIFYDNVTVDSSYGICWNGDGPGGYAIHRSSGPWTNPNYQQLQFTWHTGFVFTCQGQTYGKSYVDFQCTTKHTNGDNSYSLYGPNSTWASYLYVGASTNRITTTPEIAQVITTNGNLHLDSGYNRDIYVNYYNKNAVSGSNGAVRIYGSVVTMPDLPAQSYYTANILQYSSSANIAYAQLQSFRFVTTGNWGGGVSLGDFGKATLQSAVVIRGDGSYYVSSGGNNTIVLRLYNNSTGGYYYYYYYQFTNVTYNHVSYPFNHFAANNELPAGTYSVFLYISGTYNTDGNDYISLTVTVHP